MNIIINYMIIESSCQVKKLTRELSGIAGKKYLKIIDNDYHYEYNDASRPNFTRKYFFDSVMIMNINFKKERSG